MPRFAASLSRLPRWWRRGGAQGQVGGSSGGPPEDPLLAVGRRVRQEREARGLNLRQLALETRISTPVLEAIERGWRDRLPEGAYLRTMLPLIEQHLALPPGCLDVVLPPSSDRPGGNRRNGRLLQRFTPGSIDVFSTWQGTLLYGALSLGLIYALNLEQQRLAAANVLSLRPVPALPPAEQTRPASQGLTLLKAYPDLRPLQRAGRGVAVTLLEQAAPADRSGAGVLQLNLNQASSIALSSDGGQRTSLSGAQGELVLQLQPPLQLAISPAPSSGEVRWNGQPLAPLDKQPGRFRLPQPAAAISARERAPAAPAPATDR